jgi:hypothetical protein
MSAITTRDGTEIYYKALVSTQVALQILRGGSKDEYSSQALDLFEAILLRYIKHHQESP